MPHKESKKLSGIEPPDDSKTPTVTRKFSKDKWGRKELPKGVFAAAGPPRVVPRSPVYNTKKTLSGVGSECLDTVEEAEKEW